MPIEKLQLAQERALSIANRSLLVVLALLIFCGYCLFFSKRAKNLRVQKNQKNSRNKKSKNMEVGEVILYALGIIVALYFLFVQIIPIYYDCANDNYVVLEDCSYTYYDHHRTVSIQKGDKKYEAKTGKRTPETFLPTGEHNAHIILLKNSKLLVYVEVLE